MFRGTIEFTADALATILAQHEIGEPHVTMQPEPVWRDATADAAVLREARGQFGRYGLVDGDGTLGEGIRDTLRATCHADLEYYAWFQIRGETVAILAGARGAEAFVAVRTGEHIRMRRIGPNSLPTELISELPALRLARFTPISLRLSDVRPAVSGDGPGGGYLRRVSGTRGGSPAAILKELLDLEEMGGGQISVAVRDHGNRRRVCEFPLRIVDNPRGRLLNMVTREPGGEPWLLVSPGTPETLRQRLEQLRRTLPA